MKKLRHAARSVLAVGLLLALTGGTEAAKTLPAWELEGQYDNEIPAGFESLASTYAFPVEGQMLLTTFVYDGRGGIFGSSTIDGPEGFTFFSLSGSYDIAADGSQTVHIEEVVKKPRFSFEGTMDADTGDLNGTFSQQDGFLGFEGAQSGPMTFLRADMRPRDFGFDLRFEPTQDGKGSVRGVPVVLGAKVPESTASLVVYGGVSLIAGKIRGKVKTRKDGTTTGKLRIKGRYRKLPRPANGTDRVKIKPWSVKLDGPVDEDGFHAIAQVKGLGFTLRDVAVTLPVVEGPPEPPPPPPPPPKNFQAGGTAEVEGDKVVLHHTGVSARFFGKKAEVLFRFPFEVGTHTAVPATFPGPVQIQTIVTIGKRTYSTQHPSASVTIEVIDLNNVPGGFIRVRATGTVLTDAGKSKAVDMILEALVE
jgi:hypothetical protein